MKTTKIISSIPAFCLIFFMSVSSIAAPVYTGTGDGEKSASNRVSGFKNIILNTDNTSAATNEFDNLRFDANMYVRQTEEAEFLQEMASKMRFNVNTYQVDANNMELPVAEAFEYLRFDANTYYRTAAPESVEMPVNEFESLRFDAGKFAAQHMPAPDELPAVN